MTGLVISNRFLFARFDNFTTVFKSAYDTIDRVQKVLFFHGQFIFPGSNQCGLVRHVGDVCAGESRGLFCQKGVVNVFGEFQRFQVNFENLFPVF